MLKFLLPLVLLCLSAANLSAQSDKDFPLPVLQTVDMEQAKLTDYVGNGKPTIIAVWATWCQPCHLELDHMKAYAPKWEEELGVNFIAVSVDKPFQVRKIAPLVKRKGWAYDILVDTGGKLQRELGFRSIPQMYVIDGNGKIVREWSGYQQGREQEVERVLRRLAAK